MFFRTLLFLILAIFVLTAIRMFAGVISKGLGGMFEQPKSGGGNPTPPASPGGELKRDPVCGTFVPVSTEFRSGDLYFCSAECRDKYKHQ
jgi:hypothetical protein